MITSNRITARWNFHRCWRVVEIYFGLTPHPHTHTHTHISRYGHYGLQFMEQGRAYFHSPKLVVFPQVVQKKWPDIREHLRVNHYFLSFFICNDILDIKDVDIIMKVKLQPLSVIYEVIARDRSTLTVFIVIDSPFTFPVIWHLRKLLESIHDMTNLNTDALLLRLSYWM